MQKPKVPLRDARIVHNGVFPIKNKHYHNLRQVSFARTLIYAGMVEYL
jgi:hypothetical protein